MDKEFRKNGWHMHKKITKRTQLLILLGLSLLVLFCLIFEANRRQPFFHQKESQENTTSNLKEKEKKVAEEQSVISDVRVLITTTNFESLFHKKVKISSNKPFTVSVDGRKKIYPANKAVTYSAGNKKLKGKTIIFTPENGAKLRILSIARQNRIPSYRGTLQLSWKKSGLLITNELPLEEYLYAVVPSELSTGNKMEALKAQAVCARSYAYNQIRSGRYKKYQAHLDDSTACQVYNNVPEDKRSRKAVNATKGRVLTSNNKVVQAYYYSTSWGCSAAGQDVWNTKSEIPYLKEKLQITEEAAKTAGSLSINLSSEDTFKKFIVEEPYETYDSTSDWYRWEVSFDQKELSGRIDALLAAEYAATPKLILTQQPDGSYRKESLRSMGTIKKIRIEKREKSGLVTQIVLVGTKNVVKVCTQYKIRKVLAPAYEKISYKKGKAATAMSLLPSAAFYITEKSVQNGKVFCFTGGGFGHGTGMSQCGAARMAKMGKTYQDILTYYFDGAKISQIPALNK